MTIFSWLIERDSKFYAATGWTDDALKALKFDTEGEAERYAKACCTGEWVVREHGFCYRESY